MSGKYKAEYEFYPAEDKHDGDTHRYSGKDHNGLSDKNLESLELRQNPYQKDKFSATFVFSTESNKRDQRIEAVLGLLSVNAGVEAKANSHGNASGFSVTVDDVSQKDLMKLAVALTHDAPTGVRGDNFHAAVMGADVAAQVIKGELERLKMTPVEAGLVSITTTGTSQESTFLRGLSKAPAYVDVSFDGYPTSPVASIRENGQFAELKGANVLEINSEVELRSGQGPRVVEAMKAAGLPAKQTSNGYLFVAAPVDSVTEALKNAGLVAPAIHDAVKAATDTAHPGQQKINAEIAAEGGERVRKMHAAGPAITAPAQTSKPAV